MAMLSLLALGLSEAVVDLVELVLSSILALSLGEVKRVYGTCSSVSGPGESTNTPTAIRESR